jgi:hypothetical protein
MNVQALGLCWFREEDWPRWRAMDPLFQLDYQHWLRRNEEAVQRHKAAGVPIEKIMVDPDEFLAWANAVGIGTGTLARAQYIAVLLTDKS